MTRTVDAILCARMGSDRLPGKVLLPAVARPLLELMLERLSRARRIRRIVVATTVLQEDEAIARLCGRLKVPCFHGAVEDVLGRVWSCVSAFGVDHLAYFGADNPLIDPTLCDRIIDVYQQGDWHYVTNNFPPSFPDGQEVEVLSSLTLAELHRQATDPLHREHPLSYIWDNPGEFRIRNVTHTPNLHHLRWTLDFPEDYKLIKGVFDGLYTRRPHFSMEDIVTFLADQEDLAGVNRISADDYRFCQ